VKQRIFLTLLSSIAFLWLLTACEQSVKKVSAASNEHSNDIVIKQTESKRPNVLIIITDDQSYPHASAYGSTLVNTPAFDRIAREGHLFDRAFVSAPSCGPSRASLLTGMPFYRLGATSMNHTVWEASLTPVTDILNNAGYSVGYTGKGWAPGNWKVAGRSVSPTGKAYNDREHETPGKHFAAWDYAENFNDFLEQKEDKPFFFWVGIYEPHRPFDVGIGEENGLTTSANNVPAFLPESGEVKKDLADYAFEIEYQDKQVTKILKNLEERGELENTLIIATSDNGMAFPRAKATVYDSGARVPTAIRWPGSTKKGMVVDQMVSLLDVAPTILDAAGIKIPKDLVGVSLMTLLESDQPTEMNLGRNSLVYGVERHFPGARPDGAGYPIRALRTDDYLYIRNYSPEADAVGNRPGPVWPKDDPVGGFGDIDGALSKTHLWETRDNNVKLADAAFGNRPAEELYVLKNDPDQLNNVASQAEFAEIKSSLSMELDLELTRTGDPRVIGKGGQFDATMKKYPVEGSNAAIEDFGERE